MKRLLILDPSLKGPGGHHFDYVGQLLRAAHDRIQIVVACHQKFDQQALGKMAESIDIPIEGLDFRPVFHQTIYHTCSDIAGIRKLAQGAMRGFRRWTVPLKRHWGQWIGDRRREDVLLQQSPCDDPSQTQLLQRLDSDQRHVLARSIADLRQLFGDVTRSAERFDAIFHTTLSELDLLALAWCLKEGSAPRESLWSLQFHFDLFLGRPDEHASQRSSPRTQRCRETFHLAKVWMQDCQVRWFATSQAIARQHDWLGVGAFEELTYPINPRFVPSHRGEDDRPMRITLAGGVRSEKGQSRLEHVVASIVKPLLESRQAVFVVQRRARKGWRKPFELSPKLSGPAHDWVEYVDHPLPESAYVELMRNADVGLMLHDGRTYHARRAGVLGEFLAAGVPVVVPAASWLANCVDSLNAQYWLRLAAEGAAVSLAKTQASVETESRLQIPLVSGGLLLGTASMPAGVASTSYLRLRLSDEEGTTLSQAIVGCLSSSCQFALPVPQHSPLPKTGVLHWEWVYQEKGAVAPLPFFELQIVSPSPAGSVPWGAVGCVAVDDQHVAECLQELHRHRQHYRNETRRASDAWRAAHDPKRTLLTLIEPSTTARYAA